MLPFFEKRTDGGDRFVVDGQSFLILGMQWACNSCFERESMEPFFEQARKMHANTAVIPIYWSQIEPAPGEYHFDMLDYAIGMCRKNGLRLIPLWFASYKNAECCYAPDDIKFDHVSYRKVIKKDGSHIPQCLCPTGTAALSRDRAAVSAVASHIKAMDEAESTVIMLQIENEPGIMGTDRCYCSECLARYDNNLTAEANTALSIAKYVDAVAEAAKEVYSLPMYTNVWLSGGAADVPGASYPSGGAVISTLPVWLAVCRNLNLIAPDIYQHGYQSFQAISAAYKQPGNPLYISEASSCTGGRAEKNVFYAIGRYNAIGFDPWSIDIPFPKQNDPPFVHPTDSVWGPQAYLLRDAYKAIADALPAVADAAGTDRLMTFVGEDGEGGTSFVMDGIAFLISYERSAGGMVISLGGGEYIALGNGYTLRLARPTPDGRSLPMLDLVRGRYINGQWQTQHPVVRETATGDRGVFMRKAGTARFRANLGGPTP